jgi:hypothetical protein
MIKDHPVKNGHKTAEAPNQELLEGRMAPEMHIRSILVSSYVGYCARLPDMTMGAVRFK